MMIQGISLFMLHASESASEKSTTCAQNWNIKMINLCFQRNKKKSSNELHNMPINLLQLLPHLPNVVIQRYYIIAAK